MNKTISIEFEIPENSKLLFGVGGSETVSAETVLRREANRVAASVRQTVANTRLAQIAELIKVPSERLYQEALDEKIAALQLQHNLSDDDLNLKTPFWQSNLWFPPEKVCAEE